MLIALPLLAIPVVFYTVVVVFAMTGDAAIAGAATVGVAGAALSIAVYVLCAPFGRLPGWGNLVLLVGVSASVDATLAVTDEPDALAGQVLMYLVGVPVVCLGVALIVRADIGVGPLEMVMLVATDRSVPLVRARVVIEATTLAVGWALGGALGLGTVGFALAAGPLIAGALRLLGRMDPPGADVGGAPSGATSSAAATDARPGQRDRTPGS